jgi:hypothetical protein
VRMRKERAMSIPKTYLADLVGDIRKCLRSSSFSTRAGHRVCASYNIRLEEIVTLVLRNPGYSVSLSRTPKIVNCACTRKI